MGALLAALAAVLAVPSSAEADLIARVERAPKDVSSFIERRAGCNHWLGEVPYDDARGAEIARAVRHLRCGDLEREEGKLRRRYRQQPVVLMLLDETTDMLAW
jgi:hypothetical protein